MHTKFTTLLLSLFLAFSSFTLPALAGQAPDYSQKQYWLSWPEKPAKGVDVFWVYPTVYQGKKPVSDIDDPQMKRTALHTLQSQAAVFAPSADIYAPLYRQCGMKVLGLDPDEQERDLATGAKDIEAAFDYYLKHLNQGRPLILAGHSQGSDQLLKLMKKRLGNAALRKKLVAAYIIGWSVTADDLTRYPFLELCHGPERTGCLISYNSVAKGHGKDAPTITKGALAVNPLTWKTGPDLAPASRNMGAVFVAENGSKKTIPHFASARVDGGALIVAPADPNLLTQLPFGPGVYHTYDYTLFFENLKQNAAQRIEAFKRGEH